MPTLAALCLLAAAAPPARASKGNGTTTADFLNINVAPRPAGLGDAFTGLADDLSALHYNPAGLTQLDRQELQLVHHQFFEGVKQEYGAYGYPTAHATIAGFFNMVNVATFQGYDEFDQPLGQKGAQDSAVGGALALRLSDWLSVGGAGKVVRSRLDNYTAHAVAADAGVLLQPTDRVNVGVALLNLGNKMRFIEEANDLPATARVGVAVKALKRQRGDANEWADEITVLCDGVFPRAGLPSVAGGLEWVSANLIALRLGATMGTSGPGYAIGVGLHLNRGELDKPMFSFDYAFVDGGDLSFAHRVGLTVRFGASRAKLVQEDEYWRKTDNRPALKRDEKRKTPTLEPFEQKMSERLWIH